MTDVYLESSIEPAVMETVGLSASVAAPDRTNRPVSVVAERFLRAIVAVVPLETIEEVHLFSPLRQGVTETGIAVVAARVALPATTASVEAEPDVPTGELALVDAHSTDDTDVDPTLGLAVALRASVDEQDSTTAAGDGNGQLDSPYADDPDVVAMTLPISAVDVAPVAPVPAPVVRHTVYSARYRLVIKGADRGKWETDMVAEADAPLLTVETVVRGVQRRAGEDSAITRMNAEQIAYALRNETAGVAGPR